MAEGPATSIQPTNYLSWKGNGMRKPRSTISRARRLAVAVAAVSVAVMCSPPAHADGASDWAASFGGLVCRQLDASPTLPGVTRVGVLVAGEGFSSYDAGRILRLSVNTFCPRHTDLLQRYIAAAGVVPGRSA